MTTKVQFLAQNETSQLSSTAIIHYASTPTTADGTLLFTQAITPVNGANELVIDVSAMCDSSAISALIFVLFEGTTCKGVRNHVVEPGRSKNRHVRWVVPATDTSTRTYTVRYGPSAGAMYINQSNYGAAFDYGDSHATNFSITEVENAVSVQNTTKTSSTASIDIAATPTTSDGFLLFTKEFTPDNADNKILVEATVQLDSNAQLVAVCLFDGTTLVGTFAMHMTNSAGYNGNFFCRWYLDAISTDARTYTVRIGGAGSTFYLNDDKTAGASFGDQYQSDLVITESQ